MRSTRFFIALKKILIFMIEVISSLPRDLQENILLFLFKMNLSQLLVWSFWDKNIRENSQKLEV